MRPESDPRAQPNRPTSGPQLIVDGGQEYLTTAEVAMLTRAPVSTVRYWRHCGTGPRSFRVGRRVLYRRTDVDHWLMQLQTAVISAG